MEAAVHISHFEDGTFFAIIKFTFGPRSQQREWCTLEIFERCQNISETAMTKALSKMPKPFAILVAAPKKIYKYV